MYCIIDELLFILHNWKVRMTSLVPGLISWYNAFIRNTSHGKSLFVRKNRLIHANIVLSIAIDGDMFSIKLPQRQRNSIIIRSLRVQCLKVKALILKHSIKSKHLPSMAAFNCTCNTEKCYKYMARAIIHLYMVINII